MICILNETMVAAVMAHVNRYFEAGPPVEGGFTVTEGRLAGYPDCWIAVSGGSASGVWHTDETGRAAGMPEGSFLGRVWLLTPPADFLRLCHEIADWCGKHPRQSLASQHIGGYSYTQALGGGGVPLGWQQVFAAELMPWRRMFTEVKL